MQILTDEEIDVLNGFPDSFFSGFSGTGQPPASAYTLDRKASESNRLPCQAHPSNRMHRTPHGERPPMVAPGTLGAAPLLQPLGQVPLGLHPGASAFLHHPGLGNSFCRGVGHNLPAVVARDSVDALNYASAYLDLELTEAQLHDDGRQVPVE